MNPWPAQEVSAANVPFKTEKVRPSMAPRHPTPHPTQLQAAPAPALATVKPADSAKATTPTPGHAAPWIKGVSESGSHASHRGRHPKPLLLWLPQYFTAPGTVLPAQRMQSPCSGTLHQASKAHAGQQPPHSRQHALSWDRSPRGQLRPPYPAGSRGP